MSSRHMLLTELEKRIAASPDFDPKVTLTLAEYNYLIQRAHQLDDMELVPLTYEQVGPDSFSFYAYVKKEFSSQRGLTKVPILTGSLVGNGKGMESWELLLRRKTEEETKPEEK